MISASSVGFHFDCFFAGEAEGCGLLDDGRLFGPGGGAVGTRDAAAKFEGL